MNLVKYQTFSVLLCTDYGGKHPVLDPTIWMSLTITTERSPEFVDALIQTTLNKMKSRYKRLERITTPTELAIAFANKLIKSARKYGITITLNGPDSVCKLFDVVTYCLWFNTDHIFTQAVDGANVPFDVFTTDKDVARAIEMEKVPLTAQTHTYIHFGRDLNN